MSDEVLYDEDESFTDVDADLVLTDEVLVLDNQIKEINAIEDEQERLEAAREWARKLTGVSE